MIAPSDVLLEVTPRNITGLPGFSFTRATDAWELNEAGVLVKKSSGEIRNSHRIGGTRYILQEPASTNLLLDSAYFEPATTAWNDNENFDEEDASSLFDGETATKFTTTASPGSNGINQTIGTLTGSPETVSMIVEQGLDNDAASIGIRDVTVGDWVGVANITDWDTGAVEASNVNVGSSASAGSEDLGTGPNGGKVLRIWLTVTPDNSGNSRRIILYPHGVVSVDSEIGTTGFLHHAQHEELPFPTSPIVTGGSSATRDADEPSVDWPHDPQEMSVYADMVDLRAEASINAAFWHIGADNSTANHLSMYRGSSGAEDVFRLDDGSDHTATMNVATSHGDRLEFLGVLASDGALTLRRSINGGGEATDTDSTATSLPGSWQAGKLWLGHVFGGTAFALRRLLFVTGTRSMDELRAGPYRKCIRRQGLTQKGWV